METTHIDEKKASPLELSELDTKVSSAGKFSSTVKAPPLPPTSPSEALWNKTVSEAAKKLANISLEEPSAKITAETSNPPPTPPQAPSLPQSPAPDRPPSSNGRLAPPPMIFAAPPAAVAKAKQDAMNASSNLEAKSAETVLPSTLLESVEKAQKTSTDLLEEMRRRRVKVQVRAASAALDAALAKSASFLEEPTDESVAKDNNAQFASTIEVGPKSPRKRGGQRPGTSGPLPMPGSNKSSEQYADDRSIPLVTKSPKKRSKSKRQEQSKSLHGVGAFDYDESSVVRTRSGALALAKAASSPTIGKQVSKKAREAVAKAGNRPSTTNSISTTVLRETEKQQKKSSNRGEARDRKNRGRTHQRSTAFRKHTMGTQHHAMKNSSSDSRIGLNQTRSKENLQNQDVSELGTRRLRRKTTVPQPFTFTSRRKQRSTPKHIRFQREALARRAEREASKGTRKTRFY